MKSGVLIAMLLLLLPLSSYCQEEDTTICDFPDVEAEFPGKEVAFMEFISSNVEYPSEALERWEDGKVYLSFVIEKDGGITHIMVERSSGSELLDQEGIRVLSLMPNWIPAQKDGEAVRSRSRNCIVFNT